jgi:hypothetical protein
MRPGEDFEALVEQIICLLASTEGVNTVERNVLVPGPDGARQIDVLIRSQVGPFDLTTIIECKDTRRVVPVTVVDMVESKMRDINAHKAAVIARRGFSKGALRKAERCGISLLRANELHMVKDLPFEMPVHLRSFQLTGIQMSGTVPLPTGTEFDQCDLLSLSGRDLVAEARAHVLSLDPLEPGAMLQWTPEPPPTGWQLPTSQGEVPVADLSMSFELKTHHRFGYLTDLPSVLYLRDELRSQHRFLIPAEVLMYDVFESFSEFDSDSELPSDPVISLDILELGAPRPDKVQLRMRRIGSL